MTTRAASARLNLIAAESSPIDALLHVASARDVETVIIGGEIVYHAGHWRNFDRTQVEAELAQQAAISLPRQDESADLFRALVPYRRQFEGRLFDDSAHYCYNAIASESRLARMRRHR